MPFLCTCLELENVTVSTIPYFLMCVDINREILITFTKLCLWLAIMCKIGLYSIKHLIPVYSITKN